MKINLLQRFRKSFKKTPINIQQDFAMKFKLFIKNPKDSQLKTHKLKGKLQDCLSFYLRDGYRMLFEYTIEKEINLIDIGPHDKYKKWNK